MRRYIKKIQSKSEETRKLIFMVSLIVCMSLVGLVWIYNLSTRFDNTKIVEKTNDDIKPFKIFSNTISNTYNNISTSLKKTSLINKDIDTTKEINETH